MSQFCGSASLLSKRWGVTSAAQVGVAIAMRLIEASAARLHLVFTSSSRVSTEAAPADEGARTKGATLHAAAIRQDRQTHLSASFRGALRHFRIAPGPGPRRIGASGTAIAGRARSLIL